VLPLGDEGVGLSNQYLCQHSAGAFTCDFSQWIVDRFRLTERDDGGISRHGVSLLSGGSGRFDTRLDTPPSIDCRHPDSGLARDLPRVGTAAPAVLNAIFAATGRRLRSVPLMHEVIRTALQAE